MVRYLIYFFVSTFTLQAYTQVPGCSRVDLRNAVLGAARDQGQSGRCASTSVADLMSYHLGIRISGLAIHMAIHRFNPNPIVARSGTAEAAAEIALSGYMCLESEIQTSENVFKQFTVLNTAVLAMRRQMAKTNQCTPAGVKAVQSLFPKLSLEEIIKITRYSRDEDFFNNLASASCKTRPQFKRRPIVRRRPSTIANIDAQLDAKKPMVLGYSSTVLHDPDPNYNGTDRSGHGSLLVGRRFNPATRQCEYLIRNSWGPGCKSYAPNACEAGHVWIRRDALMRRSSEITYLD